MKKKATVKQSEASAFCVKCNVRMLETGHEHEDIDGSGKDWWIECECPKCGVVVKVAEYEIKSR